MCGRFARTTPPQRFAEMTQAQCDLDDLPPRYNILPGQPVLACRISADGVRELALLRWPYIPPFEKQPKTRYSTINAKAETLTSSRLWRFPFQHFRCLIAADGFYEPRDTGEKRKPQYYFHRQDGQPFFMAGLWGRWEPPEGGEGFDSCAIVTTEPNSVVGEIHPRMPAILLAAAWGQWLDPEAKPGQLQSLLQPVSGEGWEGFHVGYYTRLDASKVIEPWEAT
ncbi:SOS response-associated peptidase [Thiohalobacter thiocyanaticus]|uniref:Abasic site processing protein n=1 Tax=Thiohalobacter thiocyanaticus TaxID=585455 RepID=A0A426QDS5_9GAMM|nr:SOS response-associated peptidase [Thiohalobacter thiocyanaticus]RRQ19918.1 SOS response-associated peptidase [Thiohalobacter thiocyanaticus]